MAVIDASVWVALFQEGDVFHSRALRLLNGLIENGEPINVPAIVFAEVVGAIRRRTGKMKHATAVLAKMQSLNLGIRDVDDHFGRFAANIAIQLGIRGADATYVALAKETGDILYTFDEEQCKRANQTVTAEIP